LGTDGTAEGAVIVQGDVVQVRGGTLTQATLQAVTLGNAFDVVHAALDSGHFWVLCERIVPEFPHGPRVVLIVRICEIIRVVWRGEHGRRLRGAERLPCPDASPRAHQQYHAPR
jgi:hypothetical protein